MQGPVCASWLIGTAGGGKPPWPRALSISEIEGMAV